MSILLTKKERDKLWEEYEKNDPRQEEEWGNIVAKTQLKRVVEWAEEDCLHFPTITMSKRQCTECWQSLLKEEE